MIRLAFFSVRADPIQKASKSKVRKSPATKAVIPASILKTRTGTGFHIAGVRSEAATPTSKGRKIRARASQLFLGIFAMIPK
jgi:hypothetical protein